jgi:peptidoglycan/LPS O-acetylase OafA/YrhL
MLYMSNMPGLIGIGMQYPVLWSLAVEEHFYAIWPMLVRKTSVRGLAMTAAMICAVSPAIRFFCSRGGYSEAASFYTWCNLDALAFGALIAITARLPGPKRRNICFFGFGIVSIAGVIVATHVMLGKRIGFVFRPTLENISFAVVIIASLLLGASKWSFLVTPRILQFLGRISYGLYLIHLACYWIYDTIVSQNWPYLVAKNGNIGLVTVRFLVATATALLLSMISREYFEERFLRLKPRFDGVDENSPVLMHPGDYQSPENVPLVVAGD